MFMVHIYSYADGNYDYLYFFPTREKARDFAIEEMGKTYLKNGYKENGFDAYYKDNELVLKYHLKRDGVVSGFVNINDFAEITIQKVVEEKEYVF